MNHKSNFSLVMLPLATPAKANADYYQKLSACWQEVWKSLYGQHKVADPLYIDGLFRQDEAAAIFTEDACVGMILFRTVDFSILDYTNDSYFAEWNSQDVKKLLAHGPRAFLATYLTVRPEYRHFSQEFKFKEVLLDIMVKRFKDGEADVISGITRKDRGIDDESYKLGATLVHENVDYMEGRFKVDLVAFYRHEAIESTNPGVRKFSDGLWETRIDLAKPPRRRLNVA